MNLIDKATIIKFHNDRSREFTDDHKKLGWKTADSQQVRFGVLASAFDLNGASVLDIGCGYADFKTFLDKNFLGVSYTGIDLVPVFVHEAARRFAGNNYASFILGDFSTTELSQVDYVFSCGALSYQNPDPRYHYLLIKKMYNIARKGIAFTSLDKDNFLDHPLLIGHNKIRMLGYCKCLSEKATLVEGYLPDDFTIIIPKDGG